MASKPPQESVHNVFASTACSIIRLGNNHLPPDPGLIFLNEMTDAPQLLKAFTTRNQNPPWNDKTPSQNDLVCLNIIRLHEPADSFEGLCRNG
jgi:hypothetical protein